MIWIKDGLGGAQHAAHTWSAFEAMYSSSAVSDNFVASNKPFNSSWLDRMRFDVSPPIASRKSSRNKYPRIMPLSFRNSGSSWSII